MKKQIRLTAFLLAVCCLAPRVRGTHAEKYAALTFDDGPAGKITEKLLDGLAERNVPATFFLCCYRVSQYPELVLRMAQEGHELGIHGCTHNYFTQMSDSDLQKELSCTADGIESAAGIRPALMRPPGGLYNDKVLRAAAGNGLSVVLWSVDPEDWDPAQRKNTVKQVLQRIRSGDIVLLHDLSRENVTSALEIADRLLADGFTFCTVSQLAALSATPLLPGKIYTGFFP